MRQGELVIRSVVPQGRREFSASVARGEADGPQTKPKILHLKPATPGKVQDQFGRIHEWKIFEPYLKS